MKKYLAGMFILCMVLMLSLTSCQVHVDDADLDSNLPAATTPAETTPAVTTPAPATPCEHVYDNACDATCNVCEEARTPSAHVYTNACDKTCNVCGATRTVGAHTYDANGVCTACGVTNAWVDSGSSMDGWGSAFPY